MTFAAAGSRKAAYDGYVLDFVADWLGVLPPADRAAVVAHPRFDEYLEESYMLGVPGAAWNLAELSDVEPREMPFHLSAQAKLLSLRPNPGEVGSWGDLPWTCCEPTPWRPCTAPNQSQPPRRLGPGRLDAHYAAVLRSGWEADDLAVAVSCSTSPMDHLQTDSGTLVLGTARTG